MIEKSVTRRFFFSCQGEGRYTGVPTSWVRLWGCNLKCEGFGQKNLDDPTTWELPYRTFDVKSISKLEELPVWHTCCDSSYSWDKNYARLAPSDTAHNIAKIIINANKSNTNKDGLFLHPKSKQNIHMAFTGGEPMMNQQGIMDIMYAFRGLSNFPNYVTVESNGTRPVRDDFSNFITTEFLAVDNSTEWFWSISPKLRTSGESWDDTIKPGVVSEYHNLSKHGQLKYVVDGSNKTWDEVDRATELYRAEGISWPVWIMPVGADIEMQEENAGKIASETISRGYNVSARVHTYLWGNKIGT